MIPLADRPQKSKLPSGEKNSAENETDRRLVDRCLHRDHSAWEEFFRRFTPSILKGIQKVLFAYHRYDLVHDEDVLWEIHKRVVERLYVHGILNQCEDLGGIEIWIETLGLNKTKDWLRERGRKKRLPQRQGEEATLSLSMPLDEEGGKTLGDNIQEQAPLDATVKAYLRKALQEINSMGQDKKEWVLRLSLILYRPLLESEMEALSAFSGYPMEEVRTRVRDIIQDAGRKAEQREKEASRAVQYWHEIRQMQKELHQRTHQNREKDILEIKALKKKMTHLEVKRQTLIEKSRKMARPSNRAIGELIGLPKDQADQVSNLLDRARKDLEKRMGGGPFSRSPEGKA